MNDNDHQAIESLGKTLDSLMEKFDRAMNTLNTTSNQIITHEKVCDQRWKNQDDFNERVVHASENQAVHVEKLADAQSRTGNKLAWIMGAVAAIFTIVELYSKLG